MRYDFVLVALSLALVGCGPPAHVAAPPEVAASPSERVQTLREALAQLKSDPSASAVSASLERTDGWLDRAQALIADDDDDELLELLLLSADNELAAVKAHYLRIRAERDLARQQQDAREQGALQQEAEDRR